MHIWIVADVLSTVPGGMRRHMELHAEGLTRLGHQATLFFGEAFPVLIPAAISRRLPGWRSLLKLLPEYRRQRPDIINVHVSCAPAWIAARRAGLLDAKIVAMSYAAAEAGAQIREPRDLLRWALAALPPRATFRHLDGIWCVNQQDVEFYVGTYRVDRDRVARIPHAIEDRFFGVPDTHSRRRRQLLFVGTWIARKGIDVLASALDTVVTTLPDVEVALCGTLSGESKVRASLSPALSERTSVLDQANDYELRKLYLASSLLLVPSRLEGLPISMLEAMACGCPPLAAANSGMLDIVEPGRNGWLEVSFDHRRWAARIIDLLSRPSELQTASRGAQQTATHFRIEPVTRDAIAWYESLLARP